MARVASCRFALFAGEQGEFSYGVYVGYSFWIVGGFHMRFLSFWGLYIWWRVGPFDLRSAIPDIGTRRVDVQVCMRRQMLGTGISKWALAITRTYLLHT